jgi:hypothetical protein
LRFSHSGFEPVESGAGALTFQVTVTKDQNGWLVGHRVGRLYETEIVGKDCVFELQIEFGAVVCINVVSLWPNLTVGRVFEATLEVLKNLATGKEHQPVFLAIEAFGLYRRSNQFQDDKAD